MDYIPRVLFINHSIRDGGPGMFDSAGAHGENHINTTAKISAINEAGVNHFRLIF